MFGIKIIVNVDGIEWKRNKWGRVAKSFLKFSEKVASKWADVVVCDNKSVEDYIKSEYSCHTSLIPYGGDHVLHVPLSNEVLAQFPFLNNEYAFKVARIEPENNIHLVLEAFKDGSLPIVVIGNWNYSNYGLDLKKRYNNSASVHLIDPIYDNKILDQLRGNAKLYVHGHSAGGTNPSLVEAMNLKLPIISYNVSFNRETTKHMGLYFSDVSQLKKAVKNMSDKSMQENASTMYLLAEKYYKWSVIANQYLNVLQPSEITQSIIYTKS